MITTSPRNLLKKFIKIVVCMVTACSGYNRICRSKTDKRGLTILTYHRISNDIVPDETVTPEEFEKQLRYIKENFQVISLEEAVEHLQSDIEKLSGSIVITFDDGYSDNYHNAYPLLTMYNVPATIFLISDFINDRGGKYLSFSHIHEMKEKNISFGSHTVSHRILTNLTDGEITREIRGSKETLESQLGQKINSFAYPVGSQLDFNDEIMKTVEASGYAFACSNIYGTNTDNADIFSLKRIGIETTDNFFIFKRKLDGALNIISLKDTKLFQKLKRIFFKV